MLAAFIRNTFDGTPAAPPLAAPPLAAPPPARAVPGPSRRASAGETGCQVTAGAVAAQEASWAELAADPDVWLQPTMPASFPPAAVAVPPPPHPLRPAAAGEEAAEPEVQRLREATAVPPGWTPQGAWLPAWGDPGEPKEPEGADAAPPPGAPVPAVLWAPADPEEAAAQLKARRPAPCPMWTLAGPGPGPLLALQLSFQRAGSNGFQASFPIVKMKASYSAVATALTRCAASGCRPALSCAAVPALAPEHRRPARPATSSLLPVSLCASANTGVRSWLTPVPLLHRTW